jgi:hypothetical protein
VKCESAIIFFESLRDSLNDIDDENINNKEEIIILTDFYINLIKNKCEECEQSIAKSSLFQQFCKIAFLAVYDSMGIQPEMFLRLRNVFAKRDSDARAYSPGDDVIDYGY